MTIVQTLRLRRFLTQESFPILQRVTSDIEYDSHPALRRAIKQNMLVNPKGMEDTRMECDPLQEHLNDDFQTILTRGNNGEDNNFARNSVAQNIVRSVDSKKTYGEALELKMVSGKHSSPHSSHTHGHIPGRQLAFVRTGSYIP